MFNQCSVSNMYIIVKAQLVLIKSHVAPEEGHGIVMCGFLCNNYERIPHYY